jgi:hypothetical protein
MPTKVIQNNPEEARSCSDLFDGMTELEFHQKLVDDEAFRLKMIQKTLGLSDEDWNMLPDEVKRGVAEPMKWHGEYVVQRIKHPTLTRIKDFIEEAHKSVMPIVRVLGWVTLGLLTGHALAFWISWLTSAAK